MIRFDFPKVFSTQFQFVLSIVCMKGRKEAKNDRPLLLTFIKYEDPIEVFESHPRTTEMNCSKNIIHHWLLVKSNYKYSF